MTLGTVGCLQCDTVALCRDHTESQLLPHLQPITAHPRTLQRACTELHSTPTHTPTTCLPQPVKLTCVRLSFPLRMYSIYCAQRNTHGSQQSISLCPLLHTTLIEHLPWHTWKTHHSHPCQTPTPPLYTADSWGHLCDSCFQQVTVHSPWHIPERA